MIERRVYFKFDALIKETDKAYLIRRGKFEVWFPKSQVTVGDCEEIEEKERDKWASATPWILKEKKLYWDVFTGNELVGEYDDDGDMGMGW